MFQNYPDIVSVDQVCEMLHVGKNSAYDLLHANQIKHVRVGRKYIIPKTAIINFVGRENTCYNNGQIINGCGLHLVTEGV